MKDGMKILVNLAKSIFHFQLHGGIIFVYGV